MIGKPMHMTTKTNALQDALIRAGAALNSAAAAQPALHCKGRAKTFVMLASGKMRVHFQTAHGRTEWAECRISAGQDCMPLTAALLSRRDITLRATSLTLSKWFEIPSQIFLRLLTRDKAFRTAVFQNHARLLPCYLARASVDKTDRLDRRLADWLLRHAQTDVVQTTHKDIARDLLTAREVVSRGLRSFAQKGWIIQQRGAIRLTAPAALMRLAKGRFAVPGFNPIFAR